MRTSACCGSACRQNTMACTPLQKKTLLTFHKIKKHVQYRGMWRLVLQLQATCLPSKTMQSRTGQVIWTNFLDRTTSLNPPNSITRASGLAVGNVDTGAAFGETTGAAFKAGGRAEASTAATAASFCRSSSTPRSCWMTRSNQAESPVWMLSLDDR